MVPSPLDRSPRGLGPEYAGTRQQVYVQAVAGGKEKQAAIKEQYTNPPLWKRKTSS